MMAEKGFFARKLRELRDRAGLSQPGLAERAGVSVGAVRQLEYGRREPTYGTLVRLARALGVSLAAFDVPEKGSGRPGRGPPGEKGRSPPRGRRR
jgi:transcriptional regulator with XRE-family HTH domain